MGPGFVAPGTQHWASGLDLSVLRDDTVFEQLPPALQQHLRAMNQFIKAERAAEGELKALYTTLLSAEDPKGYHALRNKMDGLTDGALSITGAQFDGQRQLHRVKRMQKELSSVSSYVATYRKTSWERLQGSGADFWSHGHNSGEGPSKFFEDTVARLSERIAQLDGQVAEELLPSMKLLPRTPTADAVDEAAAADAGCCWSCRRSCCCRRWGC